MIYSEEKIRNQIKKLYQKNLIIHINLSQTRPKISLKHTEAKIIGIYLHFFRIEIPLHNKTEYYSIRYADIISNQIYIEELNNYIE